MNPVAEVIDRLTEASTLVITAHDRPDGDAIGATLGLARILRSQGKTVHLVGCHPIHPLDEGWLTEEDVYGPVPTDLPEGAILVCLDCGAAERAEVVPAWLEAGGTVLNIDHHHSNQNFGTLNWVDAKASSSSEMVLRLSEEAGWAVPPAAAEVLWVGVVTDTGRYTHENTSPAALRCGARLMEWGARPWTVGERLYQSRSEVQVRIEGRAVQSLELHYGGRLGLVALTQEDFDALNCGTEAASSVVNIPRSIAGVEVSLFFYEMAGGTETKLSIRAAEPFDATVLAGRFGGGGHQRAAGCSQPCRLAEMRTRAFAVIEELWGETLKGASARELTEDN